MSVDINMIRSANVEKSIMTIEKNQIVTLAELLRMGSS